MPYYTIETTMTLRRRDTFKATNLNVTEPTPDGLATERDVTIGHDGITVDE